MEIIAVILVFVIAAWYIYRRFRRIADPGQTGCGCGGCGGCTPPSPDERKSRQASDHDRWGLFVPSPGSWLNSYWRKPGWLFTGKARHMRARCSSWWIRWPHRSPASKGLALLRKCWSPMIPMELDIARK